MKTPTRTCVQLAVLTLLLAVCHVHATCTEAGSSHTCHDTGCRVNGGYCNSACVCVRREHLTDIQPASDPTSTSTGSSSSPPAQLHASSTTEWMSEHEQYFWMYHAVLPAGSQFYR